MAEELKICFEMKVKIDWAKKSVFLRYREDQDWYAFYHFSTIQSEESKEENNIDTHLYKFNPTPTPGLEKYYKTRMALTGAILEHIKQDWRLTR